MHIQRFYNIPMEIWSSGGVRFSQHVESNSNSNREKYSYLVSDMPQMRLPFPCKKLRAKNSRRKNHKFMLIDVLNFIFE
jgi:hypothetical protein